MRLGFTNHPAQLLKQSLKLIQLLFVVSLTVYLAACGSAPKKQETAAEFPEIPSSPDIQWQPIELPPSQFSEVFNKAESQLLGFDWMGATQTLKEIPLELASPTDRQYMNYLQARIHYVEGDQQEAAALWHFDNVGGSQGNLALDIKSTNFRRHTLRLTGKTLQSALLGDQIAQRIAADRPVNRALMRSIWHDLQRTSVQELQQALAAETNSRWAGWIQLSLISATAQSQAELRQELSNWLLENPDHPSAAALPGGLEYMLVPTPTARKVALLLPLSGRLAPAAKAVRDGYLSKFYAARSLEDNVDKHLRVLDLDRYNSITAAYDAATADGAELIIGPLSKRNVTSLGDHPDRRTPVLALNRSEETISHSDMALIQLALSPEDEVKQISRLAFGTGARRALIVRPSGQWGAKMEHSLRSSWEGLGGQVSAVASYSGRDEYSSSIAGALDLPESEQRAREIRGLLGGKLEFTARRRKDADIVFLLSRSGAEARSVKPLLAYHYAGALPVYATSSVYNGIADVRDKDLNGIRLVETPWRLGSSPRSNLTNAGPIEGDRYASLRALGADAFLLQSRLSQFQSGPEFMIRGNTGLLSLDPQLRIVRELQPATFDRGVLRAQ
ncbi:MAG: penicillin-binding protein activator [Halioglobus sp.]